MSEVSKQSRPLSRRAFLISSGAAVGAMVFATQTAGMSQAAAATTIANDTTSRKLTVTGTRYVCIIDYNWRVLVSSLKVDGMETLQPDGSGPGIYTVAKVNGSYYSSLVLQVQPVASVSGNTATVTLNYGVASEVWTITGTDACVELKISRVYAGNGIVEEQGSPMMNFLHDRFVDMRWPGDGGNFPIGGAAEVQEGWLAGGAGYNKRITNARASKEQATYALLASRADGFGLLVEGSNNFPSVARGLASEINRIDNGATRHLRVTTISSESDLHYATGTASPEGYTVDGFRNGKFRGNVDSFGRVSTDGPIFKSVTVRGGVEYITSTRFTPADRSVFDNAQSLCGIDSLRVADALNTYGRWMMQDTRFGAVVEAPGSDAELPALEMHWVADMAALFGGAAINSVKASFSVIRDSCMEANGHIRNVRPGDTSVWGGDYVDMSPGYALGIARTYAATGDTAWLADIIESVERTLDWHLSSRCNPTTLLTVNTNPSLPNDSSQNDYWEKNQGAYNGYASAMLYEALVRVAELERYVLGRTAKAAAYEAAAATLKTSFNRDTSAGGFWSPATNTVLYGSSSADCMYMPAQGAALRAADLLSPSRRAALVKSIEERQAAQGFDIHVMNHLSLFASAPGFVDGQYYSENGGWYGAPEGDYLSGVVAGGDPGMLLSAVKTVLLNYSITGFYNTTAYHHDGLTPAGVPGAWFPSNVYPIWALFAYGYGYQPTFDSLVIAPYISAEMNNSTVSYEWRGTTVTTTYWNLHKLTISASSTPTPIKIRFVAQTPGATYTVKVDGVNNSRTANADGVVEVVMSAPGTHTYELVNGVVPTPTYPVPPSTVNLAAGKMVWASSNAYAPAYDPYANDVSRARNATDGSASTWWNSDGRIFPSWIIVNLGRKYPLGSVRISFADTDGSTFKYRLEGSVDRENWVTLVDRTASGVTTSSPVTEVVTGEHKYVRLWFADVNNGHWASCRSIEVFSNVP